MFKRSVGLDGAGINDHFNSWVPGARLRLKICSFELRRLVVNLSYTTSFCPYYYKDLSFVPRLINILDFRCFSPCYSFYRIDAKLLIGVLYQHHLMSVRDHSLVYCICLSNLSRAADNRTSSFSD